MSKEEWIAKAKAELIRVHDRIDLASGNPTSWTEQEIQHMQQWAESLATEGEYFTGGYTPEEAVQEDLSYL